MHKCYSNHAYMHGYCKLLHLIYIFFSLSTSLSLFLSGLTFTSGSLFLHWSSLLSQVSPQLCHHWSPHSLLLTLIAAAHADCRYLADRRCYLFLSLMVLVYWSMGFNGQLLHCSFKSFHSRATVDHLTCRYSRQLSLPRQSLLLSPIAIAIFFSLFDGFGILISGFWLVVLGFWWVGWWWWLCRLMMKVGLMIAATLFFLCLIIDGGWVLSQKWIFYWINVYNRQTDVGIL